MVEAAAPPLLLDPASPLSAAFRDAVSARVHGFLAAERPVLDAMGTELADLLTTAGALLAGGKRLRAAFCMWSFVAAGGAAADLDRALGAAASLELLHASALVHDDVMDASDLRRGEPAAHRQFESWHAARSWRGSSAAFGRAGAILLGDLLLMWSVQLLADCGFGPAARDRAQPVVAAMRTEVTCGQYLDIVAQAQPIATGSTPGASIAVALDEASRVVEYKSARYSVQRPCQLGAALAGGEPRLQDVLSAYGSPLGRAFQFRDDLLGVFGDPELTGKPAGDDLREGKRTVLIAHALAGTDAAGRDLLLAGLGDPELDADGVARLQDLITASGAREAVEEMITAGHEQALAALEIAPVTTDGRQALTVLADLTIRRDA